MKNILFGVSLQKQSILKLRPRTRRIDANRPKRTESLNVLPGEGVLLDSVHVLTVELRRRLRPEFVINHYECTGGTLASHVGGSPVHHGVGAAAKVQAARNGVLENEFGGARFGYCERINLCKSGLELVRHL